MGDNLMIRPTCALRSIFVSLVIALLAISLAGCPSRESSAKSKLDGVYHQLNNGPMTLTIKDGKAIMTIGTESQTLDYKVEGNKLTIINPKEGNADFTINDDGTLNSEIGSFQKNKE
jgi:hypothetical protein